MNLLSEPDLGDEPAQRRSAPLPRSQNGILGSPLRRLLVSSIDLTRSTVEQGRTEAMAHINVHSITACRSECQVISSLQLARLLDGLTRPRPPTVSRRYQQRPEGYPGASPRRQPLPQRLDQFLGLLGRLLCLLSGLRLLPRLLTQLLRLLGGPRTCLLRLLDGLRSRLLRLLDGMGTCLRLGGGACACLPRLVPARPVDPASSLSASTVSPTRLRACWSRARARPSAVLDDRRLRRLRSHNTSTTKAKAAALPWFATA